MLALMSHRASTAAAHLRTLTRDFGIRLREAPTGTPRWGALRRRAHDQEISRQSTNRRDSLCPRRAPATRRGEKCGLASRLVLVLLGSALALFGSEARAELSESKRLLIRELLQLSGGGQAAEQVAQSFLSHIWYMYGSMVEEVVASEPDLSAEEKQALREHLADFDRFADAFSARFAERIDLDAVLESVYVPLYDRYFADTELREIVAFYRTPAGRKMIRVLPSLMRDGLESTVRLVEPKVMALAGEILADRRMELLR